MNKAHENDTRSAADITPDDLFHFLAAMYNNWLEELPEDPDGREPLERYAKTCGLPENSPLCMMFLAYCNGFLKGMETMDIMCGGGADNA